MTLFSNLIISVRIRLFLKTMKPVKDSKILALGGQPAIWDFVETPLIVTCVNLPGIGMVDHPTHGDIRYVEGDACHLPDFQFSIR